MCIIMLSISYGYHFYHGVLIYVLHPHAPIKRIVLYVHKLCMNITLPHLKLLNA